MRNATGKVRKPKASRQSPAFKGQVVNQGKVAQPTVVAGKGSAVSTVPPEFRTPSTSTPSPKAPKVAGAKAPKSKNPSVTAVMNSTGTKPPKTPTASKSKDKVTAAETRMGKRYAAVVKRAKVAVTKKMTAAQRKDVVAARKEMASMRKQLAKKGYGKTFKTKSGGVGGKGIYKALTGQKASTIKKPKAKK